MTGGADSSSSAQSDYELLVGAGLAAGCFAATFRGPKASFWGRMTTTGILLGGLALWRRRDLRSLHPRPRHLIEGTVIAAGLYLVFQGGDRVARRVMPSGGDDIADIYALRKGQRRWLIAARLATVIGPAEELFWRGWLQDRIARRRGRWAAAALAASAYAAVHVASGNPTLTGAAGVAGAYWSTLAATGVDIESLIWSHVLWDIVIFLVAPTSPMENSST